MPAEYTPAPRRLDTFPRRLVVLVVGQTERLQRAESLSEDPDSARPGLGSHPVVSRVRLLVVIAHVAVCVLSGCARQQAEQVVPPPPDVVLITIDTLRADRVGAYGGRPETTPNLDQLAGPGVTFVDATAHVPLTAPSHASILTGLYPPHHTLRDNGGFVLSPRSRTLAELLRERGYHTAAFVASYVLNRNTGLARGFETYGDRFDASGPHPSLPGL